MFGPISSPGSISAMALGGFAVLITLPWSCLTSIVICVNGAMAADIPELPPAAEEVDADFCCICTLVARSFATYLKEIDLLPEFFQAFGSVVLLYDEALKGLDFNAYGDEVQAEVTPYLTSIKTSLGILIPSSPLFAEQNLRKERICKAIMCQILLDAYPRPDQFLEGKRQVLEQFLNDTLKDPSSSSENSQLQIQSISKQLGLLWGYLSSDKKMRPTFFAYIQSTLPQPDLLEALPEDFQFLRAYSERNSTKST